MFSETLSAPELHDNPPTGAKPHFGDHKVVEAPDHMDAPLPLGALPTRHHRVPNLFQASYYRGRPLRWWLLAR
jgi:hypothetical protein